MPIQEAFDAMMDAMRSIKREENPELWERLFAACRGLLDAIHEERQNGR